MVVSEPPGIECGSCAYPPGMTCPDPQFGGACSFEFESGTQIRLGLADQMIYFAAGCLDGVPPSAPAIPNCVFTITYPMTVTVQGLEAIR